MHDYPSNVDALEEDVKTITTAHQKSPDSLWKCVLRTTLLGILSLFMLKPSLPPGVCVNVNTYDGINVYGYARTYAVRIAVHGRVIALMSVCVCFWVCGCKLCQPQDDPALLFQLGQFYLSLHGFWVGDNRPGTALEAICHQRGLIGATVWPLSAPWRGSGERLLVRLKLVWGSIRGLWCGVKPD